MADRSSFDGWRVIGVGLTEHMLLTRFATAGCAPTKNAELRGKNAPGYGRQELIYRERPKKIEPKLNWRRGTAQVSTQIMVTTIWPDRRS
jgi:hypothetical protein